MLRVQHRATGVLLSAAGGSHTSSRGRARGAAVVQCGAVVLGWLVGRAACDVDGCCGLPGCLMLLSQSHIFPRLPIFQWCVSVNQHVTVFKID